MLSLRKGIQIHLESEKPVKPDQNHITLKPFTDKEKRHIIKEWERNCQGESIIRSAVIKLT